ncbi:ABC transporter permease [Boudabousia marimammalium]|uniref:Uncharacterized protein n=1 Tax=Boudabousia marimammalium TaxID=156892 RepID=A0A1Q5PKJ6_9ACTO|nr:FtsX-like permease family protein [Boudabousia marimammalium]OKL46701.1 hypothetical protein BM477_07040 [Boudabousia marimammalium]
MFLAFKEITHEKRHFALITAMITLVGILAFFLTALAVGLLAAMTQGIQKLDSDYVLLSEASNQSIQASLIPEDAAKQIEAEDVARLGLGVLTLKRGDERTTTTILAMDPKDFTAPQLVEGKMYGAEGEVVADDSLKQDGYKLGDTVQTSQRDEPFKIVGFTTDRTYAAAPIVYMTIPDWQSTGPQYRGFVSAITTKGEVSASQLEDYKLTSQTLSDFYTELPGVSEQNLTFMLMVIALIIVSAVILGIFIYVLTLQKRRIFGVMKTQGISNWMIGWSVIWQTAILSILGSVLAVVIVIALQAVIPPQVPITIPWLLFGLMGAIMVGFSLLGALFSVRSATKVDPLIALK